MGIGQFLSFVTQIICALKLEANISCGFVCVTMTGNMIFVLKSGGVHTAQLLCKITRLLFISHLEGRDPCNVKFLKVSTMMEALGTDESPLLNRKESLDCRQQVWSLANS